jgi:hypothetical protein
MKKLILALALAGGTCGAHAANTSATLTVDNLFYLYSGNAAGNNLVLQGQGNSWPTAYSFSFDVNPGDYLYVVAQDQGGPQGWQGYFSTPLGALYSNKASWDYIIAPTTDISAAGVMASIAGGSWAASQAEAPYNAGPWGSVVGNVNATWMWHDNFDPSASDRTYAIFRTVDAVAVVPEPASYAMLLAGVGLLGVAARRRRA